VLKISNYRNLQHFVVMNAAYLSCQIYIVHTLARLSCEDVCQSFSLTQQWLLKFLSSGMWHHVVL